MYNEVIVGHFDRLSDRVFFSDSKSLLAATIKAYYRLILKKTYVNVKSLSYFHYLCNK